MFCLECMGTKMAAPDRETSTIFSTAKQTICSSAILNLYMLHGQSHWQLHTEVPLHLPLCYTLPNHAILNTVLKCMHFHLAWVICKWFSVLLCARGIDQRMLPVKFEVNLTYCKSATGMNYTWSS